MKNLSDLIKIPPIYDRPVRNLTLDSRAVQKGDVFFACQGLHTHGRQFLQTALDNGAAAVLLEQAAATLICKNNVPCIGVPNLSQRLGELAAHFYQHPSRAMPLIGVTGTNGKTSITHFLAQSLPPPCGLLGTLGYGLYGDLQPGGLQPASHTTPDALRLQAMLADMQAQQASHVVMEVSSHALAQERVSGLEFDIAVLSNLSRDHLDYHGSLENYAAAKAKLFHWRDLKTAVLNWDDDLGQALLREGLAAQVLTYSRHDPQADIYVQRHTILPQGYELQVQTPQGSGSLNTHLLGEFNISNLLAALGVLLSLEMPLEDALHKLSRTQAVAGRMEVFHQTGQPLVVVDYAHTPDALQQALTALRPHCLGRLYCVFGCGGDRDKGKRPLMGRIAQQYADVVILTNDNPRTEDPQAILQDIQQGFQQTAQALLIPDRQTAIGTAMSRAGEQDVLLVAGKGHEDYQHIGAQRVPFSDRECVAQMLDGSG